MSTTMGVRRPSRRYRLLTKRLLHLPRVSEAVRADLRAWPVAALLGGATLLQPQKRSQLDRLYQRVIDDLNNLLDAVGLKAA